MTSLEIMVASFLCLGSIQAFCINNHPKPMCQQKVMLVSFRAAFSCTPKLKVPSDAKL